MNPLRAVVVTSLIAVQLGSGAAGAQPAPYSAALDAGGLEQRAHELALVRHVRQHLAAPEDGVALAADRLDLRNTLVRASRQPAGDSAPLGALTVLADVWNRRVNDRVPFAMMGPDVLGRVNEARRALAQALGSLPVAARQRYAPAFEQELLALAGHLSGRGAVPDDYIDRALATADAGAAGRPAPYAGMAPGPSPYGVPRPPVPYPGPPGPRPERPNPYGEYAQPAPDNPANPASASGAAYGSQQGGSEGCRASRSIAGDSFAASDFLRNAECWSRMKTWPGSDLQVAEALDWAAEAAVVAGDCQGLDAVARQMGPLSAGASTLRGDRLSLVEVRRRLDADRAWLRSQGCR